MAGQSLVGGLPSGLSVLLAPPLRGYYGRCGNFPHDPTCRLASAVHGVCPATAWTKLPQPPQPQEHHGRSWRRLRKVLGLLLLSGLAG